MENSEKCLMGIILNNPELFEKIKETGNVFTGQASKLFSILEELYKKQKGFDKNTIIDFISDNKHFSIADFYEIYESEYDENKYESYLSMLLTRNTKKELKTFMLEVLNNDYKSHIDLKQELVDITEKIVTPEENSIMTSQEACREALEHLFPNKVDSNIEFFDYNQNGFSDHELIFLGGRPGTGKTTYARNLVINDLKNGLRIGFITAEMSIIETMRLMACSIAGLNHNDLDRKDANGKPRIDQNKLIKALEWLYEQNLFLDDSCYIEDIIQKIKIMKNKYKIQKIYIDHLHHLDTHKVFFNEVQKISYMISELKKSNLKLLIPHIILGQLNREGIGRPNMTNCKGSGKIEEVSNIILLMWEKEKAIDGDHSKSWLGFAVEKNRSGKIGEYESIFLKTVGKFKSNKLV